MTKKPAPKKPAAKMPTIPRKKQPTVEDLMQELDATLSNTGQPQEEETDLKFTWQQFDHLGPDLSRDATRLMNACNAAILHSDFDPQRIKNIMTGIKTGYGPWVDLVRKAVDDEPGDPDDDDDIVMGSKLRGALEMAIAYLYCINPPDKP
jgi:hypothetical protein